MRGESEGVANNKLRGLLPYNKPFKCTDVRTGGTGLLYKAVSRKSTPNISDIAETGALATFQSQAFKMAQYCVRKKVEEKDVEDGELHPLQNRTGRVEAAPWADSTLRNEGNEVDADEGKGETTRTTGTSGDGPHPSPGAIPVSDLPSLSAKGPPSPRSPTQHPVPESSFHRNSEQSQAPEVDRTLYEKLMWGQHHGQCPRRGYHRKGTNGGLEEALGLDERCGSESQTSGR